MPSPYRDSEQLNGWVPWFDRLLPLVAMPGRSVDFPTTSSGVARTLSYNLRRGAIPIPPGEWKFTAWRSAVRAEFIAPPH